VIGEYCNTLLHLWTNNSETMSIRFRHELEVELNHRLKRFELETRIVENTKQVVVTKTYKQLKWL